MQMGVRKFVIPSITGTRRQNHQQAQKRQQAGALLKHILYPSSFHLLLPPIEKRMINPQRCGNPFPARNKTFHGFPPATAFYLPGMQSSPESSAIKKMSPIVSLQDADAMISRKYKKPQEI